MAKHSMSEIQKLNTMEVSDKGKEIIKKFFHLSRNGRIFLENPFRLIVSLYATMQNNDHSLVSLLDRYYVDLKDYLTEDEIHVLQEEASAVMRFCYKNQGGVGCDGYPLGQKMTGEMLIPEELLSLFEILTSARPLEEDVYIPFAGHAQLALYRPYCSISGFEIDRELWALSKIVLDTCGINANIQNTTSPSWDTIPEKKYDCIVSFPPFLQGKEARIVVDELYRLASKSLKDAGMMFCFLPADFCNSHSHWVDLRKLLIENNEMFSATIISLGAALNPHTGVNICAFILQKDNMGSVELIDASGPAFHAIQDKAGNKRAVLKPISILESRVKRDELYVWKGKVDDLKDDINLLPGRYLLENRLPKLKEGEKRVALRKLIEIGEQKRIKDGRLPLVGMKELSSNYINCEVQAKENLNTVPAYVTVLENDYLLVGFINGRFKVGKISGINYNSRIGLQQPVVAIKLVSDLVSEDYLLRSLLSDEVKVQADLLSTGVVSRRISVNSFLDIQITIPTKEEQIRLCREDASESLSDAEKRIQVAFNRFRDDVHMKKHAIGQTVLSLESWWKVLQIAKKEGLIQYDPNTLVDEEQGIALKDVFDSLYYGISQIKTQINRFDRGHRLVSSEFLISDFLNSYMDLHKKPEFKYMHIDNAAECIVNFPQEALTMILDNIVSNACSHGFGGKYQDGNIVKLETSMEGTDCIIMISNNGNPLVSNISPEDVFVYSRSGSIDKNHSGIGGYEVRSLMQQFDGDADFISKPDDDFPICYKLVFHNTKMNLEDGE